MTRSRCVARRHDRLADGFVLAVPEPAHAAPGRPYTDPVKPQKGGDPWLRRLRQQPHHAGPALHLERCQQWQLQPV